MEWTPQRFATAWAPLSPLAWVAVVVLDVDQRGASVALVLENGQRSSAHARLVPAHRLAPRDPRQGGRDKPKAPPGPG